MSDINEVVDSIMRQVSGTNVEAIFGESRQVGDKVVIPVGQIKYGWGVGGGKGPQAKAPEIEGEGKPEGEGAGAGMGIKVTPLGFITVTADSVKYEPIIDYGPVITIGGVVLGLALLKVIKALSIAMYKKPGMMRHGPMHKWMCPWKMHHGMKQPGAKHH